MYLTFPILILFTPLFDPNVIFSGTITVITDERTSVVSTSVTLFDASFSQFKPK